MTNAANFGKGWRRGPSGRRRRKEAVNEEETERDRATPLGHGKVVGVGDETTNQKVPPW
jgi:hypothetical protein